MATESRSEEHRVPMRKIRSFVQRIVERFDPEQVILFGSHGYGTPTESSDVDLLVVMDTELRPVWQAIRIREAIDRDFPLDLVVRTPTQLRERLALGDFFLREIVEKGRVLYERPRA